MSIYDSLPFVARALSYQTGVNVTVGGSEAFACIESGVPRINIPFYKDADSVKDILIGFSMHEIGHILETDFNAIEKTMAAKTLPEKYNRAMLHALVNIAEDLRIERKIIRRYPGSRDYLKGLNVFMYGDELPSSDNAASVFLNTMCVCGFYTYHGLGLPTAQLRIDFDRLFGQSLYDQAMSVLSLAVNAPKTSDCLDVAIRLYDLAVDAFNDNDDKNTQDDQQTESDNDLQENASDSNSTGDKSEKSASGFGESILDSSVPSQPQDNASLHRDPGENSDTDESLSCSAGVDPFANVTDTDLNDIVKSVSERINEGMSTILTPYERSPAIKPYEVASVTANGNSDIPFKKGIAHAAGIRLALHGLLQGHQHIRRSHKETGRKLDCRILTSALTGNRKVFKHKSKSIDFNAAFTVLLDSSGSLKGSILEAEAAVISLLYALEGIKGVSTSAYHFPHAQKDSVGLLKGREQCLRAAQNANQFGVKCNGSTPLTQSLWPALCDLISAKADRHILIIVTDGEPDDMASSVKLINDAKKDGVIVIGIGFGRATSDVMSSMFGKSGVYVGCVSSLKPHLLNVARNSLSK